MVTTATPSRSTSILTRGSYLGVAIVDARAFTLTFSTGRRAVSAQEVVVVVVVMTKPLRHGTWQRMWKMNVMGHFKVASVLGQEQQQQQGSQVECGLGSPNPTQPNPAAAEESNH